MNYSGDKKAAFCMYGLHLFIALNSRQSMSSMAMNEYVHTTWKKTFVYKYENFQHFLEKT